MKRRTRYSWPPESDAILLDTYGTEATAAEIGVLIGTTRQSVLNRARKLGLQKTKHYWTPEQRDTVARLYDTHTSADIAAIIGRTAGSVYDMANKLGLKKSTEWIAERARERISDPHHPARLTRFQPGHETWNKGKPHPSTGRAHETQFRPGQMPHTWRPVGSTRRTKEGYLERKTADTGVTCHDYEAVHHLVWRMHGGTIPTGQVLAFRDGNVDNCTIANLELITRADLMTRNSLHRYPPEIADVMRLRGVLNRKIRETNQRTTP